MSADSSWLCFVVSFYDKLNSESRHDFHFWILLLLLIASPHGTELKIQVQSCWKSLPDRLLQESVKFSFVNIFLTLCFRRSVI